MLTRPFTFIGDSLKVNYATSAIGSIRFEICDETGKNIAGYSMRESELLFGNAIEHTVLWNNSPEIKNLRGETVRLRARMHDADFYSFRFGE